LERDSVSPDDDFYTLGGDSILAIRAVAAARERGVWLALEELLLAGTVRGLARRAGADGGTPGGGYQPFALLSPEDRELVPAQAADAYPLTALQLGMLYHQGSQTDAYHSVTSVVVYQPFDEARLRRCLVEAVDSEPGPPFGAYVALERAAQQSPDVSAFWTRYLSGVGATQLPRAAGHPGAQEVHRAELALSTSDTARLHEVARQAGVPVRAL